MSGRASRYVATYFSIKVVIFPRKKKGSVNRIRKKMPVHAERIVRIFFMVGSIAVTFGSNGNGKGNKLQEIRFDFL